MSEEKTRPDRGAPVEALVMEVKKYLKQFTSRLKAPDIIELLVYGSLAYLSYQALKTVKKIPEVTEVGHWEWDVPPVAGYTPPEPVGNAGMHWVIDVAAAPARTEITYHWQDAVVGPIGLKLATTMGGTPPLSQIAGLTILATLGLASIAPNWIGNWTAAYESAVKKQLVVQEAPEADKPLYNEWVMAQISGSTRLGYCEWATTDPWAVEQLKGLVPKVCMGA